jgi:anthraniloyl-CoA monooxygenase
VHCPPQSLAGCDQLFRLAQRDRADLTKLRLKARPKSHAATWKQAAE